MPDAPTKYKYHGRRRAALKKAKKYLDAFYRDNSVNGDSKSIFTASQLNTIFTPAEAVIVLALAARVPR